MGRGAQQVTIQASDQERANINALNQQFLNQRNQLQGSLVPQYQDILNNPGHTPAQQAAITGQSMGALARKMALHHQLDPALVCAVIEQESAWNPWAVRYEPAFFARYVAPLYASNKISATKAYARGFSWGLMQVMGQVARENGFEGTFLLALCDPGQGITVGAASWPGNWPPRVEMSRGPCSPGMAKAILSMRSRSWHA